MMDYDYERCDCGYKDRQDWYRQANREALSLHGAEWLDRRAELEEEYERRLGVDPPIPRDPMWTRPSYIVSRDWHTQECPSLADYPMVDFGTEVCPKCRSDVEPTWHDARWHYTPHDEYWRLDLDTWSCVLKMTHRPVEHVERRCRCGWVWVERPADA